MKLWTRKHGSQRKSREKQAEVELQIEPYSEAIIVKDEDEVYHFLKPETLGEIDELEQWIASCKARIVRDAKKAGMEAQ